MEAALDPRAASIPVELQRQLLEAVVARGSESTLLGLAAGLAQAKDQPLLFVMLNSRNVDDLIDKEQRFNRFFHSDHRVRVLERGPTHIELEHYGPQAAPARVESLFVLGIHLALFERIGCQDLVATLPGSSEPDSAVYRGGDSAPTLPRGGHGRWRIRWGDFEPRHQPMEGLDEVLLSGAAPPDLEEDVGLRARVVALFRTDLAHRWTLAAVARSLHTSTRGLQRELAGEGTSFTRLLDEVRVAEAAQMLLETERTVTEIGYLCGFSDAAHFSRRFKGQYGSPPLKWREERRAS